MKGLFVYLEYLSSEGLIALGLVLALGGSVSGFATDAVMGRYGFGPYGNGILVMLGTIVGVDVALSLFGNLRADDMTPFMGLAALTAASLLILFGFVKRMLHLT